MTREVLIKIQPVLDAFKSAKPVQVLMKSGDWRTLYEGEELTLAELDRYPERYRVKPEPREWWILDDDSNFPYRFSSLKEAQEDNIMCRTAFPIVHVREVIE
jgi:hypothetical protein